MRARIVWALVVFGVLALAAAPPTSMARDFRRALAAGQVDLTGPDLLRGLRVYLTDELDTQRYLAYADAVLGRPYQPYFIRSLDEWQAHVSTYAGDPEPDQARRAPAAPLVPYRDFSVEYPPGFFLWVLPPATLAHSVDGFLLAFTLWMGLLATLALWLTARLARRPAFLRARPRLVAHATGAALALGAIVTHRFDAAVLLLLAAAVCGALERRPVLLGVAMGLAVVTKGIPLLAAPALAMWLWREDRRRELGLAIAVAFGTGLLVVAPVLLSAWHQLGDAVAYHLGRPLQIESTSAALIGLFLRGSLEVVQSYGSVNLVGAPARAALACAGPLSLLLVAGALAGSWYAISRAPTAGGRERALVVGVIAPLVAFMTTAKVFSPQYLVWVMLLGTLLSLERGGAFPWLWLGICIASQLIYPVSYRALSELRPWAVLLLLLRNLTLAGWASALLVSIARQRTTVGPCTS